MDIVVYDKVKWHYPDGKNCPDLPHAKQHFVILMEWLSRKGYLTEYGKEMYETGIDADFSLTSEMVMQPASELLAKNYNEWLADLKYDGLASGSFWDEKERTSVRQRHLRNGPVDIAPGAGRHP